MNGLRAASLGMYDFAWLEADTDALWTALARELRAEGVRGVPDALDHGRPLHTIWRDPGLLLAQTCGYPLLTELSGGVRLVATPHYAFPGCDRYWHRSFLVVRADDPARGLAALRGRRCAINGRDSNTGMNLLRASIAPLARGRRFFDEVIETGAHLESLRAVREGRADLAALDCVTHGLLSRRRTDLLAGSRVLGATPATPGLPFITSAQTTEADLAALRTALMSRALQPALARLGVVGMTVLGLGQYRPVTALAEQAGECGYAALA